MSSRNKQRKKKYKRISLGTKLILLVFLSLAAAGVVFLAIRGISGAILIRHFSDPEFMETRIEKKLGELQDYVTEQEISSGDWEALEAWVKGQQDIFLRVYKDGELVFDSNSGAGKKEDKPEGMHMPEKGDEKEKTPQFFWGPHTLMFADGEASADLVGFFQRTYLEIVNLAAIAAAFAVFLIIMICTLKKWISYLNQLSDEVHLLEGGDLDRIITVKGHDELSELAVCIDEMRKSFVDRLENESLARKANSDLITAMSHDLRTPLTTQIGYLDIIEYEKYKNEDQLKQYIHKCREKAYQIKALSDKLFEYFLAFNQEEAEEPELESYDGRETLTQLVEEHIVLLQEKGFSVCFDMVEANFQIQVDIDNLCRVFDNIFSNLMKYAAPETKIQVRAGLTGNHIRITFENERNRVTTHIESTGIGLKNSRRMMEELGGALTVFQDETCFRLELELPVYSAQE
ncbi:HAMP domain-containing sensor histidine kinase [Anaerolentibacter hominis]|uniref:sensor histidine kinase n=1 Tax=Anaerolentibacter hominis TaxID=3079009 RepID=UPI0031B7EF58